MCPLERVCCEEYAAQSVGSGSWPLGTLDPGPQSMISHTVVPIVPLLFVTRKKERVTINHLLRFRKYQLVDPNLGKSEVVQRVIPRRFGSFECEGKSNWLGLNISPRPRGEPTYLAWSAKFWYGVTCVQVLRNPRA